jgi:putative spermidine/putrescine transport system ATP-binding protein
MVSGRVSAVEYQGFWLKITLEEASGEEFVVNQSDSTFFADPLEVGDEVVVQWQPEEVHYLTIGEQTGTTRATPATAGAH